MATEKMPVPNIPTLDVYNRVGTPGTPTELKVPNISIIENNKKQSKFDKFMNKKGTMQVMQGIGSLMNGIPSLDKNVNSNDEMMQGIRNTASDALLQSGNPYAMAAGLAVKVIDKTGAFSDASQGLGGGVDALNSIASIALPGAGWFAPPTRNFEKDSRVMQSSGFTGLQDNMNTAAANADAKLIFGRDKANQMIADADYKQTVARGILDNADLNRAASNSSLASTGVQNRLSGGFNPMFAKKGTKVPSSDNTSFAKNVIANNKNKKKESLLTKVNDDEYQLPKGFLSDNINNPRFSEWAEQMLNYFEGKPIYDDEGNQLDTNEYALFSNDDGYSFKRFSKELKEEPQKYKQGGSFNVIPDGALHKNRHHLEEIDDKFKEVTHKGIPVISESKGGEITQHAEVEKEEIIFRLEVTQKLEELAKENTSEAAIEAGKLLVEEILHNTIDKTNKLL